MKEYLGNSSSSMELHFLLGDVSSKGGIERVTITLANALSSIYPVKIISLYQSNESLPFKVSDKVTLEVISNNYEVSMFNRNFNLFKGLCFDLIYIKNKSKKIKEIKKSNQVIAISSDVKMSVLANKSGYKNIIAIEHFEYDVISPVLRLVRKFLYKKIQAVVSLTSEDERKYKWLPTGKHFVIANIVEQPISVCEFDSRSKTVLAVGRLTYQKGFDLLIEAWRYINLPGWTLKIVGDGEEYEKLSLYIKEHNLQNIQILPFTNNISKYYNDSRVFVLSSRYEGLGMVLVEALSYGLACISFNCPAGPKTILNQGNGILVEPENVKILANEMTRLMLDKELQKKMSELGPSSINRFKSDVIIAQWMQLIKGARNE
ncbi:glycosyltransferase family 4 protein [Pantoea sp. RIT-PI-b]|uniref:glycosyltransferase family 4 protein n=1 Tax=Pantoea sp. RIT-PI-b TaxID=1681195 RepID=UPI001F42233C|nr:glycosyltransferase family 4 protein [Pantoea sp. RIT-PI-b]